MAKAVTEETKNAIRRNLLAGASIAETVDACGVSRSTVKRIKKEMPDALGQSGNSTSSTDYSNTPLTKSEEQIVKRYHDEQNLFEDPEEGWVFHVTKNSIILKTSGKWWMGIVYPESAPEYWIERLKRLGCEIAISPLHDRDVWSHDSPAAVDPETGEIIPEGARYKAGDPKKPHYHILIKLEQSASARDINATVRPITNGPYLQKCRSLRNNYEYFLHKNDPDKFQFYDKNDIIKLNGFHLEPNKFEQGELMEEILREAREKGWTSYGEVLDCYGDCVEEMQVITARPGVLTRLLKEQWMRKHPDQHGMTGTEFNEGIDKIVKAIEKGGMNNHGKD